MAELRRRKGDGDLADPAELSPADPSTKNTTTVTGAAELPSSVPIGKTQQPPLIEPLHLSDSATADSSDHVGCPNLDSCFRINKSVDTVDLRKPA